MLYIIRHGQTELNTKMLMQGRSDHPLNDTGMAQAAEAADRLAKMGITIDKVYSSPLIRAIQTAEKIAPGKDIVIDDRLIEMEYGPYEGMDLRNPAPEVMAFFMDFANVPVPEGMEPLPEIVARLGEFLEEIREEAASQNVLISTHAIAMKGALEYLTPDSHGSYWDKNIRNCDVYFAAADDSGYEVPVQLKDKLPASERFLFRSIKPEEADRAAEIELIVFPPNEAAFPDDVKEQVALAPELFLVAIDKENGELAGFLNGISTNETVFRDEFFTDKSLYDPDGSNVMLLGLDVLPEYQGQGLGRELMNVYCKREKSNGRSRIVLTCLPRLVEMYKKFGFADLGLSGSTWGGEVWHEMERIL